MNMSLDFNKIDPIYLTDSQLNMVGKLLGIGHYLSNNEIKTYLVDYKPLVKFDAKGDFLKAMFANWIVYQHRETLKSAFTKLEEFGDSSSRINWNDLEIHSNPDEYMRKLFEYLDRIPNGRKKMDHILSGLTYS